MSEHNIEESDILARKLFIILALSVAAYSFCALFFAYG
jgi:hypothetical protein